MCVLFHVTIISNDDGSTQLVLADAHVKENRHVKNPFVAFRTIEDLDDEPQIDETEYTAVIGCIDTHYVCDCNIYIIDIYIYTCVVS